MYVDCIHTWIPDKHVNNQCIFNGIERPCDQTSQLLQATWNFVNKPIIHGKILYYKVFPFKNVQTFSLLEIWMQQFQQTSSA